MTIQHPPPPPDAPRSRHHAYAQRHGYFWLPCPRCSRWWGGHEAVADGGRGGIRSPGGTSTIMTCCPDPVDGVEPPGAEERMLLFRRARGEDV